MFEALSGLAIGWYVATKIAKEKIKDKKAEWKTVERSYKAKLSEESYKAKSSEEFYKAKLSGELKYNTNHNKILQQLNNETNKNLDTLSQYQKLKNETCLYKHATFKYECLDNEVLAKSILENAIFSSKDISPLANYVLERSFLYLGSVFQNEANQCSLSSSSVTYPLISQIIPKTSSKDYCSFIYKNLYYPFIDNQGKKITISNDEYQEMFDLESLFNLLNNKIGFMDKESHLLEYKRSADNNNEQHKSFADYVLEQNKVLKLNITSIKNTEQSDINHQDKFNKAINAYFINLAMTNGADTDKCNILLNSLNALEEETLYEQNQQTDYCTMGECLNHHIYS